MVWEKPILTIGIPTYNRAEYLNICLSNICKEVGNDDRVEIIVSDNNSNDNTEQIVKNYMDIYGNISYHKNNENLGFDKNIRNIYNTSKGEYIKLHGDDDFYNQGSFNYILKILTSNNLADLLFIHCGITKNIIAKGYGIDQYIISLKSSNGIAFLTSIIIRNKAFKKIEDKERFIDSKIYQVYISMEILKQNPNFILIGGPILSPLSGKGSRRLINVGEIFIKNYFDILSNYDVSKEVIIYEKKNVYDSIIIPLLNTEIQNNRCKNIIDMNFSNLEKIFVEYYKYEDDFNNMYTRLKALLNKL